MKSNIEIAPKKYHINCSYDDAVLYCFQLKIRKKTGWRLPTMTEWFNSEIIQGWYLLDEDRFFDLQHIIMPVRDIT